MTIKKIKINTAVIDRNLDKRMFLAVVGVFFALLSLYVFFVGKTVINIIGRKTAESEMRALSSSVSNMEIDYMTLAKNIDLDMAQTLGFKEPKDVYFASRTSSVGSLTKKANEL
jgi:hypothetical protein